MKKSIFSIFLLITISFSIIAQETELTLEDAVIGRWTKYAPERTNQFSWVTGTKYYSMVSKGEYEAIQLFMISDETPITEVTLEDINKEFLKSNSEINLTRFPRVKWVNKDVFRFNHEGNIYEFNHNMNHLTKSGSLVEGAENYDFFSSSKWAYTIDNNLYIYNDKDVQVTNDSPESDIQNGKLVHREEFGIHQGTFWSPKGNLLAYYRNDQSMVSNYPLVDITTKPASLNNIKYPMAGMTSEEVSIGIYNVEKGSTTFLQVDGPKDQYLTNIAWAPDEKTIYVVVLNRDQNHVSLNQYDASTGAFIKTLFEEKEEKYIQILNPIIFLPNNPNQFIWQSERNGYYHLYVYDTNGKLIRQLTDGEFVVTDVYGFDNSGKNLYGQIATDNGMDRHIFKVDVTNGKSKQITKKSGVHYGTLNSESGNLKVTYSQLKVPNKEFIIDGNGKVVKELVESKDPLSDVIMGETSLFSIDNGKGTSLNCRMIKPADFNEFKRYPVLVYLYNGPGVQILQNRWLGGAPLWMHYFANKGYIVFTVEGRGSENRGKEFEQALFRNLGAVEREDQLAGVDYLKSLSYVDGSRMGIHGWSYGGYMTTNMMLNAPGTFQVGVAGGPVMDWKYYEVMYTERYMDTPETNPEGYAAASMLDKVKNLEGDLLLIHGAVDDVVVWQNSLDFVRECVKNKVQIDYFTYPTHPHNVRGVDRVHLMEKVLNYLDEKLQDN